VLSYAGSVLASELSHVGSALAPSELSYVERRPDRELVPEPGFCERDCRQPGNDVRTA
jgi:hypothetical protein